MGAKRKLGRQEIQKEHTGGVTTLRWATSLHVLTSSGSLPTRQVQMFGGRHSSRCWACSFSFLCPSTIIQSSINCLGLALNLLFNIFNSITFFNSDSPLRVCPIKFNLSVFIVHMSDLSPQISLKTNY